MANIDFDTARIIVENAMRVNKMGGTIVANGVTLDLEKAWKTVIDIDGKTFEIPINYQNFRDAIAKSIVDSLTALTATGQISQGPIDAPNAQVVVTSPNANISAPIVNINNPTTLQSAARVGDTVTSSALTDPAFWTWIGSVSSSLSIPPPVAAVSKITQGSSTVKIGG